VPPPVHDRRVADQRQQESTGIRTGHPTKTSRGVFMLNQRVASAISINPIGSALSTQHSATNPVHRRRRARRPHIPDDVRFPAADPQVTRLTAHIVLRLT
jgi:hypothetical protein